MDNTLNFEMQLSELELLVSMFPGSNELEFEDPSEFVDLRKVAELSNSNAVMYNGIGFTVRLSVQQHTVELAFRLPLSYPQTLPSICLRSATLNGSQQRKLSVDLLDFMTKLSAETLSSGLIIAVINWTRESVTDCAFFKCDSASEAGEDRSDSLSQQTLLEFSRLWIYSHHIYNREKRRAILDISHDMKLTGFCASGKPGVICVEGLRHDTDFFWQSIRSMQWQRITLVHREDFKCLTLSDFEIARRFEAFEEKHFESNGSGASRGTHMDRGQLLQFLVEHSCGDIFHMYFGVGGNSDCVK